MEKVYSELMPTVLHLPNYDVEIKYEGWTAGAYSVTHKYGLELIVCPEFPLTRQSHTILEALLNTVMEQEYCLIDNRQGYNFGHEVFVIIRENPILLENKFRDRIRYDSVDFPITYVDELQDDRVAELAYSEFQISLLNDYPEHRRIICLWHEIFHIIIHRLTLEVNNIETLCSVMASFMVWFIENNDLTFLLF